MGTKIYTYNSKKSTSSMRGNGNKKRRGKSQNKKRTSKKKSLLQRIKEAMSFGLMIVALIGILILYGIQYATIEKNLVEIRQLKKEVVYLESQNTSTKVEIKRLEHVNRIYEIASKKLGMVPLGETPGVLRIDNNRLKKAKQEDLVRNG